MAETTIIDVAKAAGVAASTVSRALNGGNVKAETRERIIQLSRQMGYKGVSAVEESAQHDASQGNLGVIVTDIVNFYFTDIFKGLLSVAQNAKYRLFLADLGETGDYRATISSVASASKGIVFVSPRLDDADIERYCDPAKTVLTNRKVDGYASVCIDDQAGILQAVRHLASLGHKHIAYVSGSDESWANSVRGATAVDVAASFGMDCVVLGSFEPSYGGGINAGDALLLERDVTGVIAFNDLVAAGMIGRLTERGLSVPGDISVVGVDDSVLSRAVRPQLTTIDVRQERVGELAMQMLLGKVDPTAVGARVMTEPDEQAVIPELLVTRESTGLVPSRA